MFKFIFFVQIFFNYFLYWKYLTVLNFFFIGCILFNIAPLFSFFLFFFFQFFIYDLKALFIWQTFKEILIFRSFLFPCLLFSLHFAILSLFFVWALKNIYGLLCQWFISCTLVILLDNNNLKFYFVYIFFLIFSLAFILFLIFFSTEIFLDMKNIHLEKKKKKDILTV